MHTVFLAHTPLHLLFTLSLVRDVDFQPAHVILVEDWPGVSAIASRLPDLLPPDSRVSVLPGAATPRPRWLRRYPVSRLANHLPLVQAVRRARQLLAGQDVRRVCLFIDHRPDVQQIAGAVKAANPGCRIAYVEDGASAYVNELPPQHRLAKRFPLAFRLVYGRYFEQVCGQGQFSLLDEAYLLYPSLASRALSRLPVHRIPPLSLTSQEVDQLLRLFGSDTPRLPPDQPVVFVALPLSLVVTPALEARLGEVLAGYAAAGSTLLFKPHPRETRPWAAQPRLAGSSIWLNPAVPGEVVLAWLGGRLQAVVSGLSSMLYTARWFNPAASAVLVDVPDVMIPPEVARVFQAAGVQRAEGTG
ncbi:MAG: hypothetical protein Kow0077_19910 [Anaerolineae bacterium]